MPRGPGAGPAAFPASMWALLIRITTPSCRQGGWLITTHRRMQLVRAVFKQTAAEVVAMATAVQWRMDGSPSSEEVADAGSRRRRADAGSAVGLDPRTGTGAAHDAREVGWLRNTLQPPTPTAAVDVEVPMRCHTTASAGGRWVHDEGVPTVPVATQLLFLKLAVEAAEENQALVAQLAKDGVLVQMSNSVIEQTLHTLVDLGSLLEEELQRHAHDGSVDAADGGDGDQGGERLRRRGRRGGRNRNTRSAPRSC